MNQETIATLHEIKQAVLQQQTLTLRQIGMRLSASEAERDTVNDLLKRCDEIDSVTAALAANRYRAFQQKALVRINKTIDAIMIDYRKAETELADAFAEVRAIEKLMQR